jgi:ligand-binding SRPBCC domain-containing protein
MPSFRRRNRIDAPCERVFGWHARPGALERLVPPWEDVRVIERRGGIEDGARTVFSLRKGPLRIRWTAEHRDHIPGRQFVDEQVEGPFAAWRHAHRFTPEGEAGCTIEDEIDYRLPLGALGERLAGPFVGRDLERAFAFRVSRSARTADRDHGRLGPYWQQPVGVPLDGGTQGAATRETGADARKR